MVQRDPSHQQSCDGGELVTSAYGPKYAQLPLLPYERTLIAAVNISEEEYVEYLRWASQQSQVQLTKNEPTADAIIVPSLIILAIGTLFTVVGTLLAKPKQANQPQKQQVKQKSGDDKTGRQRYSPTYGFDSATELASYGTPVPIHFGQYRGENARRATVESYPVGKKWMCNDKFIRYVRSNYQSGGLVISPILVWSRMYSMGTGQLFQGVYLVGDRLAQDLNPNDEGQTNVPKLSGVWIGNNTLDKLSDQNFALYWDSKSSEGRVQSKNLIYGTQDSRESGNPFVAGPIKGYRGSSEPFPAPVCNRANSSGFSMAWTPQNQTAFGCYAPIMNGSDRRVPWRVISLPKSMEGDARDAVKEERKKVCGGSDRMRGAGRGYGRLMGLTKKNDKRILKEKEGSSGPKKRESIKKGDKVTFEIIDRKYDKNTYDYDVSVADLTNESDAERAAADDAFQLGEEFMIGASRFRVTKREKDAYELDEKSTWAELECLEDRKDGEIGFTSKDFWEDNICSKSNEVNIFDKDHIPSHWYPLLKYQIASFRNIRKAEVTEVGIRSRVWAQMNGMCNFPTIPTPNQLENYDKDNVQWTNGVQSQYFTRFSFFQLQIRKADVTDPEDLSTFKAYPLIFAIRGKAPIDQYNFIRIKPSTPNHYEYRFYPLSGAWAASLPENPKKWDKNSVALVLDSAKTQGKSAFKCTYRLKGIGEFEIRAEGKLISIICALTSPLMLGKDSSDKEDGRWCPPEVCDSWTGRFNKKKADKDKYNPGGDKEVENNCSEDFCEDDAPSAATLEQIKFFEALPDPGEADEEKIADYIKDGLAHVGCVDCGTEVPTLFADDKCSTKYDWDEDDNEGKYYIRQTRTAAGPGGSARISEKWVWDGDTIQQDQKTGTSGGLILGTKKKGDATYKAGNKQIDNGGTTSGTFTWKIERCVPDESGGGNSGGGGGGGGGGDGDNKRCNKPHWNIWEYATQAQEGSYYAGLINRSCDSAAEHEILYVNECVNTDPIIQYPNMTMMGLSLKATRQFTQLDQPRAWLPGGINVKRLYNDKISDDFSLKNAAPQTASDKIVPRSRPNKVGINVSGEVKCHTKDRRILRAVANFKDGVDPKNEASKIRWMVQWFKGKTRQHSARIKNPDWIDTNTEKDWRDRDPHATLIKGNEAKIVVPKDGGWYTCYMWPGETNTTNDTDVDNESGLDFGPESNTDETNSLTGITFRDNDTIYNIFAGGVKKVRNQRTDGNGDDRKYRVNYEYLWSGKKNYSSEKLPDGRYVYWYEIPSKKEEFNTADKENCPDDTKPPGPPAFQAYIVCGGGFVGDQLKVETKNCGKNDGEVRYQWQFKSSSDFFLGGDWRDTTIIADGDAGTTDKFTPQQPGRYRCVVKCSIPGRNNDQNITTDSCFAQQTGPPVADPGDPPKPGEPDDNSNYNADTGTSNNYADLIYHLLTDEDKGLGRVLPDTMVDKDRMIITSKFLDRLGLTFDGTIAEQTNLRTFASATAPYFLCNFTVTNGNFTLWPVIPVDKGGRYINESVRIKQIFTEGNIIDGSFKMTYLDADDRRRFKANMRYRQMNVDQLPEERVLQTRWYKGKWSDDTEDFDMTQFCTTQEHALLAARYFMWIRNVVNHSVSLQTVPEVMNGVGPGDFIRLEMETVNFDRSTTAVIDVTTLEVRSASTWEDGPYEVAYWLPGMPQPSTRVIEIVEGKAAPEMAGALMSRQTRNDDGKPNPYRNTYQVESVSLGEEGLVDITATWYPCDKKGTPDLYDALFAQGDYKDIYKKE